MAPSRAASTFSERTHSLEPLLVEEKSAADLGLDGVGLGALVRAAGPLAVVDLETTGLAADFDELLEFGAVLVDPDPERVTTLRSLVRPRRRIPLAVRRLTGLEDADVATAPPIEELASPIASALAGRTIVAHNADFERAFLSRHVAPQLGAAHYLDTQDLLGLTHPDAPDLRLATFTERLLGTRERHRGLEDALDTARVICRAAEGARAGESRYAAACAALERFAPDSPWRPLLEGKPLVSVEEESPFVPIPASQEPPVPFDEDAIAAALADGARGARHFPGYRVRPEQIRMAREFFRVLHDGGRLLLEGGTGSGKSLAYLAAAIPFTMERNLSERAAPVLVSTRTKLLQDQLLSKDIPAAAAMFGHPQLRALSIKGRANYACARRLERTLAEGRQTSLLAEDRLAYAALATCARTRRHGEVGTLPAALLYRFPALRDLRRRAVAARAEQCSREQCAQERGCPLGRRRAALARAHLVVANHDLLLRWPNDYPAFGHVVVDEAHDLAGVVDEVFAEEVRPGEVLERIDELFGRPAPIGAPSGRAPRGAVESARRRAVREDLAALGESLAGRASEFGEVQLPTFPDRIVPVSASLAETAAQRLVLAADDAEDEGLTTDADGEEIPVAVRAVAELRGAGAVLRAAFAGGEDHVASFEGLEPPWDRWRLALRAVEPAREFHERFADRLEALACVSASLFVGGDPFAALGTLDIESPREVPLARLEVPSPFPYREHMRVVALEANGDLVDATAEVLIDLSRALGGRTLGLFTSLRRMREVADILQERLRGDGFDVLVPRRATDDPSALVERFARAGSGGVLLGARTFWQGLDLPGDALQAVVIEKLPFEVPTELRRRRESRLRQVGEDAFARFTTGVMLLNLKQMVGRLIRSETDRGIAVVVDGRIDRSYFTRLDEALPPGSNVRVARRDELLELLAEVGIGDGRTR